LQQEQRDWANGLPDEMSGHRHLHQPFMDALASLSDAPDRLLAADLTSGFVLYGKLPQYGWWSRGERGHPAIATPAQLFAEAAERRQRGDVPTSTAHLERLWQDLHDEVELGWWSEPVAIDDVPGDFVSSLYFGKEEGLGSTTKIRGLVAPYPNAADTEIQRMRLDGVDGLLALVQLVSDEWSRVLGRRADIGFAKEDWRKGFKQVWLRPDQRRLYGIHLRHWRDNRIMVLFPNVMLFGPRKAPLQFARAPLLLCHVLRKRFHIPAYPHLDDIILVEECGPLGDQAHDILLRLHELCGWKLHEQKRVPLGRPSLTQCGVALGLQLDLRHSVLSSPPHAVAMVSLDEHKRAKYLQRVESVLRSGFFPAGEAARVGGQASYSQTHTWQRSGRALLWPIYDRCHDHSNTAVTRHLQWCLQGLQCFYSRDSSRLLHSMCIQAPRAEIYTDARGTVGDIWGSEFLGGVLQTTDRLEYFMAPVSDVCWQYLDPVGQQRINQCEAAGALVALQTWGASLSGHWVTLYIDNSAAEGSIAKGYSKSLFMARIASACWRLAERFGIGLWIGRVPSSLNPADALSREDDSTMRRLCAHQVAAEWLPAVTWDW